MDVKGRVRATVRAARRARPVDERARAADLLADRALALPEVTAARTVTAYVSTSAEPGTLPLRVALRVRGTRVLLPVLLADGELDWAVDDGVLRPGLRPTIEEPTGRRLGPAAIAGADVVVCPATAVAVDGTRLGKGGGSYDRSLSRTEALVVALLHDDEVFGQLPSAAHDRPVHVAVTPTRTLLLGVPARAHPGAQG